MQNIWWNVRWTDRERQWEIVGSRAAKAMESENTPWSWANANCVADRAEDAEILRNAA